MAHVKFSSLSDPEYESASVESRQLYHLLQTKLIRAHADHRWVIIRRRNMHALADRHASVARRLGWVI